MKLNVYVSTDSEHQDSFWFDGKIAETDDFVLEACGEIKIYTMIVDEANNDEYSELVYDGKSRNSGFEPKNDSELPRNDNGDTWFDANNWFEVWDKEDGDMGDIYDTYDEALLGLIKAQNEKDNEKEMELK